jgi:hypothetical protein
MIYHDIPWAVEVVERFQWLELTRPIPGNSVGLLSTTVATMACAEVMEDAKLQVSR